MYMQTARSAVHGQGTLDRVEERNWITNEGVGGMGLWIGAEQTA